MSIFTRRFTQLSVVDATDLTRVVGVLEIVRGGSFKIKDVLSVLDIYPSRDREEMKVFVLDKHGRENGGGTLRVIYGNFRKGQTIVIHTVE